MVANTRKRGIHIPRRLPMISDPSVRSQCIYQYSTPGAGDVPQGTSGEHESPLHTNHVCYCCRIIVLPCCPGRIILPAGRCTARTFDRLWGKWRVDLPARPCPATCARANGAPQYTVPISQLPRKTPEDTPRHYCVVFTKQSYYMSPHTPWHRCQPGKPRQCHQFVSGLKCTPN